MNTKKIEELLGDISNKAEVMAAINAENGKDVEAVKLKLSEKESELGKASEAITAHKTTIAELEKAGGDSTALKTELERYKLAENERTEAEKKAVRQSELATRFSKASEGKTFAHEYIKSGVFSDFEKALADEANKGKGDAELFETITKDKNYFANANPPVAMEGMGNIDTAANTSPFKFNFTGVRPSQNNQNNKGE